MSRIANVTVIQSVPVKPSPEGGDTIGWIYPSIGIIQVLLDDPESPHDGNVLVKGPVMSSFIQTDGTYRSTKQFPWVELSHLQETAPNEHEYKLIVDAVTGAVKSCVMVR